MTPTDPQDDIPASMPDPAGAPDDGAATIPPEAPPAPEEETNEQWMHRFIAENAHLVRPRPERPPPPPPSPWDGPISSWKVPDHLTLRHPNGGYMAMALFSRTMDDLDEVTKGERAATYEEVDKYFGHALIAEGLVPFTYTADEAIRWWKAGGHRVLGGASASVRHVSSDGPFAEYPGGDSGRRGDGTGADTPPPSNAPFMVDPHGPATPQTEPAVLLREKPDVYDAAVPTEDSGVANRESRKAPLEPISARDMAVQPFTNLGEKVIRRLSESNDMALKLLLSMPSTAANALANSMRGSRLRDLTPGEYGQIFDAFRGMIDLSDVKIVIGAGNNPIARLAFADQRRPAITIGNTVYINAVKNNGSYQYYSADLSGTPESAGLLIHELYHVLQYQRSGFALFAHRYGSEQLVYAPSWKGLDTEAVYNYPNRNLKFNEETIEGQAQIAGDYAEARMSANAHKIATRPGLKKRLRGTGVYGF